MILKENTCEKLHNVFRAKWSILDYTKAERGCEK